MIPYFAPPSWHLGPFTFEVFGLFVAAGIVLGASILAREALRDRLDAEVMRDFAPWAVGAGIVGGHLVHLFLYHPEELHKSPFQILKVWDGLSSFGGLLGAIIFAVFYFRKRGYRFHDYGDVLALGVAPAWAVARLGCFAVHDHPGVPTDFFMAVNFPGGPRHDLGLYDALWLAALTGLLFLLRRRRVLAGRLLPLLAILYSVARIFFDSLRATDLRYVDARYHGLTPAQYGCLLLIGYGIWGMTRKLVPRAERGSVKARSPGSPPGRP